MVLLNAMTSFYLSTFAVNYRVYTVINAIKGMKPCKIKNSAGFTYCRFGSYREGFIFAKLRICGLFI